MTHPVASSPSVVVYVSGGHPGTAAREGGAASGPDIWAALKADHLRHHAARRDPDRSRRRFPDLWRDYVNAHFRDHRDICAEFGVSERCARKWLEGCGGCSGANLATAYARDPDAVADLMLAAAE